MISITTKSTESWLDVAVWNEQTGGWFDLNQARDMDDAHFMVAAYAKDEIAERGSASRYLIRRTVETEVVVDDVESKPKIAWGTAALRCHVEGCDRVTERRVNSRPTCIEHLPKEARA